MDLILENSFHWDKPHTPVWSNNKEDIDFRRPCAVVIVINRDKYI